MPSAKRAQFNANTVTPQEIFEEGVATDGGKTRLVWIPDDKGEKQKHRVSGFLKNALAEIGSLIGKPAENRPSAFA